MVVRASSETHVPRIEFQSFAKVSCSEAFPIRASHSSSGIVGFAAHLSRLTRNLAGRRFLIANPPDVILGLPGQFSEDKRQI